MSTNTIRAEARRAGEPREPESAVRRHRPLFGEQRALPARSGFLERLLFRSIGVADPAHYLHFCYLREALDSLRGFMPKDILDAGCGRGDYSFYLARRYSDAEVVGIDISEKLIERNIVTARLLGLDNVKFEVQDASAIGYRDAFDLVVSIDVLEHIRNQEAALRKLATALRTGGFSYYHIPTVRQRPVPFSRFLSGFQAWAQEEHVAGDHTADTFGQAVQKSGLSVLRLKRTFGYFTGEMATSLFALPYSNTPVNRALQGLLSPLCKALAWADRFEMEATRYAVSVLAGK